MKPKKKRLVRRKAVTESRSASRKLKTVIPILHQLKKKKQQVSSNSELDVSTKKERLEQLEDQIHQLGGMNTYQHLSKMGEDCHGNQNTAKWVVEQLRKEKMKVVDGSSEISTDKTLSIFANWTKESKISLLDVGALRMNYESHHKWINGAAIDLNPQHLRIQRADFLKYKADEQLEFDVIVLSLVLNFSENPDIRGLMIKHAVKLTKRHGFIFIMLPEACINNSRYLSLSHFTEMMCSLGCQQAALHTSPKLIYFMFQRVNLEGTPSQFLKKKLAPGPGRNNFAIVIK